ncbi:c-type cytochrome domain-containing protein [Candidatus Magnetaquicoccus inordinatus]|uniref:c-type cytochrome domain-containing protein n=1 Tax=Candidatus Magnetaquicoccus inordinatus TaxID=2496818 RepID=UPI001D0E5F42|nr:c-type cytochrome domain-containing protein [Candidatus Magnetaquicoccus inordinatus]
MHGYSRKKTGLMWAILSASLAFAATGSTAEESSLVSFKSDVMPILQYRCLECHRADGPGVAYSGLNLESYEGLMKGTRFGPVVVPGNAMVSNLNVLVEGRAGIRMPHNRKRLTPCEIQVLRNWVTQGAKNN